jgi:hypothetical protein
MIPAFTLDIAMQQDRHVTNWLAKCQARDISQYRYAVVMTTAKGH